MKVVFCSNFFNHHQLYLSLELYNNKDVDYTFIATEGVPKERLDMGYEDMNKKYPFILRAYESDEQEQKAMKVCEECDVLIIGSAPEKYIVKRLGENKLTFRYSERILRRGTWRLLDPRLILSLMKNHTRYVKKNLYMLCASAYTAYDFSLVGAYRDKCYKWGYFPECEEFNIDENIKQKNNNSKITILWTARFLKLKHPELMLQLAQKLIKQKYDFEIIMIGNGELFEKIKENIKNKHLENYIKLTGAINYKEVRDYMKKANIFLFTSDKQEGWGAVLNESMNSGCAVVANRAIGSVPYLIENNINGMEYRNKKEFFDKVLYLMNNTEKRAEMAKNAYYTITKLWNAKNAANNFVKLSTSLLKNEPIKITEGPCSIDKRYRR